MAANQDDSAAPTVSAVSAAAAEQPTAGEATEDRGEFSEEKPRETPDAAEENAYKKSEDLKTKWPGWPGYSVFRLVVPVLKVGGIIGRKGDLIKKLVEETRARVRVLEGPITSLDRIVLITGKEDPEAALPPAVDAILRIFKRVSGLPENVIDGDAAWAASCLIRLLVPSTQAISLIGKQGSLIKSVQENTGASVRVTSSDDLLVHALSDERVVELKGEAIKVLKALEAVAGHLRKFLVDQSVLPLFEKSYNAAPFTQEKQVDAWPDQSYLCAIPPTSRETDYPLSLRRDSYYLDHESQIDSHIPSARFSVYGPEHGLGSHSSRIGHPGGPLVTQMVQTMQIPLAYAEDIIGIQGVNVDYIRRSSGAILTVQECRGLPDEIMVEIKGASSQVQAAQQLIQEFISGHRDRDTVPGSYGNVDTGYRPSYTELGGGSSYLSLYPRESYEDYGGYNSYRL